MSYADIFYRTIQNTGAGTATILGFRNGAQVNSQDVSAGSTIDVGITGGSWTGTTEFEWRCSSGTSIFTGDASDATYQSTHPSFGDLYKFTGTSPINCSGGSVTTNCWWQASIAWTNKTDLWAVLDFTVTDGDGDQYGLSGVPLSVNSADTDPNLGNYAGIPVAPGAVFSKTIYLGADSGVSPFTFVSPGSPAVVPTWRAGDSRALPEGKVRAPDSTGDVTKICSTNSMPSNTPPGTVEDISLSLTNGFNPLSQYTNKFELPPGPVNATNPATGGDISQLASVVSGTGASIERAIRDGNALLSAQGGAANSLVAAGLTNLAAAMTNLQTALTNVSLTTGTNANRYYTNAYGRGTNTDGWLTNYLAGVGTNPMGSEWGVAGGTATNLMGSGMGEGTNSGWGGGGSGAGDNAAGTAGVMDALEAPGAGWGELPLGWSNWKLDLKALLSAEVLEDPSSAIIGAGSYGTTMSGITGFRAALRTFLIWCGLVSVTVAVTYLVYGYVKDVYHTPTVPVLNYTVLGTTVPGAGHSEQIAKATVLVSTVAVLPSMVVTFLASIGAVDLLTAVSSGGVPQLNADVPSFGHTVYLVNHWFPFGEYAAFALNYLAVFFFGQVAAVKLMTLAKFL